MGSSVKEDIELLKTKINNEIYSLSMYEELSYVCDSLRKQIDAFPYDENDEYSLKKYRAYLETFLELKIGYINRMIVEKVNGSIFDNRTKDVYEEIKEIESEIDSLLDYIDANFPIIGEEVRREYNKLRDYYVDLLIYTKNSSQRRFDTDVKLEENPTPILSIYSDTASAARSYINRLRAFKIACTDSIKVFVENDKKVKELFKNAYDNIGNPVVVETIKQMENNYIEKVKECIEKGCTFTSTLLLKVQESMLEHGLQIDEIVKKEKEKENVYNKLMNMTIGFNSFYELEEIRKYVMEHNIYVEEFYKVLYFLVEKEKYERLRFGIEPEIYNSLSENNKLLLQKLFLSRLSLRAGSDTEEVITSLKKNGYLNTMDAGYEHLFNSLACIDTTFYHKEPFDYDPWADLSCIVNKFHEVKFLELCKNGKEIASMALPNYCNDADYFEKMVKFGNIYRYCYEGYEKRDTRKFYLYFDENGKRIKKIPNDAVIVGYAFDHYIIDNYKGKKQCVVDSNFKVEKYSINLKRTSWQFDKTKNKLISILDDGEMIVEGSDYVFDYSFNSNVIKPCINGVIANKVSLSSRKAMTNDGVVPIVANVNIDGESRSYISYFDIARQKEICHFEYKYFKDSYYEYSEGLMNFVGENGLEGYMNIGGKVIIEPQFDVTKPFKNGLAMVKKGNETGFIDHKGVFTKADTITWGDEPDYNQDESRYEYHDKKLRSKCFITASSGKRISGDEKILELLESKPYLNSYSLNKEENTPSMK